MAESGRSLRYPTLVDIVRINRRQIEEYGGEWVEPDNLKERGSLAFVLEAIRYRMYGVDLYPGLVRKVARLTFVIIRGHVFWDGCKRTGVLAMQYFALSNGYRIDATRAEFMDMSVALAAGELSEARLQAWIRERLSLRA